MTPAISATNTNPAISLVPILKSLNHCIFVSLRGWGGRRRPFLLMGPVSSLRAVFPRTGYAGYRHRV
jgi:hypothetical protein